MTLDLNKVYVAASSGEVDRAKTWMAALRDAGFEVTSTWPERLEKQPGRDPNPRDADPLDRAAWALACLDEVAKAGVVWMLAPGPDGGPGRGAYAELAAGKTLRKVLFASGDTAQSIYGALAQEHVADMDAFLAIVKLRADAAVELLRGRGCYVVEGSAP